MGLRLKSDLPSTPDGKKMVMIFIGVVVVGGKLIMIILPFFK